MWGKTLNMPTISSHHRHHFKDFNTCFRHHKMRVISEHLFGSIHILACTIGCPITSVFPLESLFLVKCIPFPNGVPPSMIAFFYFSNQANHISIPCFISLGLTFISSSAVTGALYKIINLVIYIALSKVAS